VLVPEGLRWLEGRPDGAAWLDGLPALVAAAVERWGLVLGDPYDGGMVSWVAPATTAAGEAVALKLPWPHHEADGEAAALRVWAGDGAVRLLDEDPATGALLLEQARPGTHLSRRPELGTEVIVGLIARLSVPVADLTPFHPLADEAAAWADGLVDQWERAGRPFERSLVDTAVGLLADLAPTQGPPVLLHQDLHADNVVAAEREPWLALDPKPLVGEAEFAAAPLCRDYDLGHTPEAARRRLDVAVDRLGLDRERARGWAVAQTLAWAWHEGEVLPRHVQTARWLLG
jgi:streptomycin 6-kinase